MVCGAFLSATVVCLPCRGPRATGGTRSQYFEDAVHVDGKAALRNHYDSGDGGDNCDGDRNVDNRA